MDQTEQERIFYDFLSITGFDMRNALTPLFEINRRLLEDLEEPIYTKEERLEFHSFINDHLEQIKLLIEDMVTVSHIKRKRGAESKIDRAGITRLSVQTDLRTEVEMILEKSRSDSQESFIDFEPEHILVDAELNTQIILRNLICGAKFAGPGSQMRVIGRLEPNQSSVLIGVQVRGVRASKERQQALFDPVSLYVATTLVGAHQGTIWTECEVDKQTTCWLRIPLQQASTKAQSR
ncbi:MAG TPA: hypothetical protein VFA07_17465 [Chthonomonadaceae bacterium]|nr:hypothetical protein [Chthonomonadaceae bacterium]